MSGLLVFSEDLTKYDFGPEHPMAPGRVTHTISLARALGVLDRLKVVPPPPIDLELLQTVHSPDYIEAVQRCEPDIAYGLGTTDNPIFPGMHEVAGLVAMATTEAARQVWTDGVQRASNISGGLHHAMPSRTSGFCVYNDVAIAIRWLLDHGCERIGYVDVDVHHGDGVQAIFYDDPRVMTVSLHETPVFLFPGTGFPYETGALGTAVNVALPPGTTDAGWLRAFDAVVPHVLRAHRPQVLVTQHGCDSHRHDPLADLDLSLDGQRASYLAVAGLADELCEGRWYQHRRGRVRGGARGAPGLDAPARHRQRRADPAADTGAGGVARGDGRRCAANHDRRCRCQLRAVRGRLHPGEPAGPSDHGDPARGVPRVGAGPRALIPLSVPAERVPSSISSACRQNILCICCTSSIFCHYSHCSTGHRLGEPASTGAEMEVTAE